MSVKMGIFVYQKYMTVLDKLATLGYNTSMVVIVLIEARLVIFLQEK